MSRNVNIWLRGFIVAIISGVGGGMLTGFAACGIDPNTFNFNAGSRHVFHVVLASMGGHALIGVGMYLQKSPLPDPEPVVTK